MAGNLSEKDLALDVAQRLDRSLQSQGVPTIMTRVGDTYVSLAERAAMTNRLPDCIMVSIHFNDVKKSASSGVETYYADHQIGPDKPVFAVAPILEKLPDRAPNPRKPKTGRFGAAGAGLEDERAESRNKSGAVFRHCQRLPSGRAGGRRLSFLNKDDAAKLGDPDYRERICRRPSATA